MLYLPYTSTKYTSLCKLLLYFALSAFSVASQLFSMWGLRLEYIGVKPLWAEAVMYLFSITKADEC